MQRLDPELHNAPHIDGMIVGRNDKYIHLICFQHETKPGTKKTPLGQFWCEPEEAYGLARVIERMTDELLGVK